MHLGDFWDFQTCGAPTGCGSGVRSTLLQVTSWKLWKSWNFEMIQESPRCIQDHQGSFLVSPNDPWWCLNSTWIDFANIDFSWFSWFCENWLHKQGFPLSHGHETLTNRKNIENDYNPRGEFCVSLTWAKFIMWQRVPRPTDRRTPGWPPEGAPGGVTWRTSMLTWGIPSGRGRGDAKHSPPGEH